MQCRPMNTCLLLLFFPLHLLNLPTRMSFFFLTNVFIFPIYMENLHAKRLILDYSIYFPRTVGKFAYTRRFFLNFSAPNPSFVLPFSSPGLLFTWDLFLCQVTKTVHVVFESNYFCHITVVKLVLMMSYLYIPLKPHSMKVV